MSGWNLSKSSFNGSFFSKCEHMSVVVSLMSHKFGCLTRKKCFIDKTSLTFSKQKKKQEMDIYDNICKHGHPDTFCACGGGSTEGGG